MSKQAFEDFKSKVANDVSLRHDMSRTLSQDGTKSTASIEEVVAFAKSRGFAVEVDDVRNVELSDDELDAVAGGASDYFLKLDGIKGETTTTSSGFEQQIDVVSWSWGTPTRS